MTFSEMLEKLGKVPDMMRARWALRRCDHVGKLTRVQGRVFVRKQGRIAIGSRCYFLGAMIPVELIAMPGGEIEIGDNVGVNYGTSICSQASVKIGNNCAFGQYCLVMDTDFHEIGNMDSRPAGAPIVIEDNVWLAARVTVLKGVTIGRNAVVSAGSVVTTNVRPYTLVGGVPARMIKRLDDPEASSEQT